MPGPAFGSQQSQAALQLGKEWLPREVGGVTIPGRIQETIGCGTWCCVLVDKVVFNQRLDSIILEVFSSTNDSVILCQVVIHLFNYLVLKSLNRLKSGDVVEMKLLPFLLDGEVCRYGIKLFPSWLEA